MNGNDEVSEPAHRAVERVLERDRRTEARVLWKGAVALAFTVALAFVRQRWWTS
jgi:hypothetical protein